MNFKYSICYPDKSDIEYLNKPISKEKVIDIAKNYPWREQLNSKGDHYSPSLDFVNLDNNCSLGLSAMFDKNNNIEFSLWFNRPKKVKIFFGLLGEKQKMIVDDFWSLNLEDSIKNLNYFVNGNYTQIEKLFR